MKLLNIYSIISIIILTAMLFLNINFYKETNNRLETSKKAIYSVLDTLEDKPRQLLNCIKTVDGTDAECDSCYYIVYGKFYK